MEASPRRTRRVANGLLDRGMEGVPGEKRLGKIARRCLADMADAEREQKPLERDFTTGCDRLE
jgi:hypothetical protein